MKKLLLKSSTLCASIFCVALLSGNNAFGAGGGADPHHGSGHHEASSAGLPQLDASTFPSQLFWLAVIFFLLYLIFSRKSLPEISSVIENRQQHIEKELETAEKVREEAEQAEKAYEEGMIAAREKATKTIHATQDKIKAKADKQTDKFREKTEKELNDLEKRLDKAKAEAMEDMNTIAAEVASEAARKIVGIDPDLEQAKTVVKALNGTNAKAA